MKNRNRQDSIGIRKFLKLYFGVTSNELLSSDITHKDLKFLFPDLKRLPFNYTYKNEDMINSGKIILVCDSFGTVIPYLSPQAEFDFEDEKNGNFEKEKIIEEAINLENLNLYKLSELCKKYKKEHRYKEFRIAYKILKEKKLRRQKNQKIYKKRDER